MITSNWKSNIFSQLKKYNQQQNNYDHIIEHYNRILENNAILQIQCSKLEKDVNHLRLANSSLEKTSEASSSQELVDANNKFSKAQEEIFTHLREKGELAREVLRLNRALTDINEKYAYEEIKSTQYKNEKNDLYEKLQIAESDINELQQINQILRDEFQALKQKIDQLQIDYIRIKPTCLELEQQLESAKRMNQRIEDELMFYKNRQADIYNYDSEKFNTLTQKRIEPPKAPEPSIFIDDDIVIISTVKSPTDTSQETLINSNVYDDPMYYSIDESISRERRNSTASISNSRNGLLTSFMRKFTNGMTTSTYDRLNRTSTCCFSAFVPTRQINHWDCTELEAYALQFQPSGSILATGCSDKMIHLWEISSNGQQSKYCSLQGSHGAINAIDFDNEGSRLIAGCSGDKAYVWSYGEYKTLKETCTGHQNLIFSCKFVSGTKLATGSADRTIKIWDLYGRQCTRTLFVGSKCHDLVVTDAAGSIISGHYDKKIRIWDPYTDKCRLELRYDAAITSLSYNDGKQQLLGCFKDDTLKLIDLRQNRVVCTFSHENFKVSTDTTKAVLSPDGCYACVGSHDGSLIIWNTENRQLENVLKQKHSTMITSVAWQPDGRYVASCEKHRRVILWSQ